ncbi:hypothetical protein [Alkalihalobacillus pseudalcaliphilus]|uniref:hypothetical protein n=1 Tax=Alkalihalobacillus pseudalcaliphilus TaxID=79884 RepID=UPI00064E0DF1|nr:hypothetical protein [Alkalihalobacillus pseudalcaliphilus]KMK75064.1 hypothetical protein AB990_16510 [Alkalihalobacillus pseudalcaliphilus]
MNKHRKAEYTLRVSSTEERDYEWLDLGVRPVETNKIVNLPTRKKTEKRYLVPPVETRVKVQEEKHKGMLHLIRLKNGKYSLEPGQNQGLNFNLIRASRRVDAMVSIIVPLSPLDKKEQQHIKNYAQKLNQLDLKIFDLTQYTLGKHGHLEPTSSEGMQILKWKKEKHALETARYERLTQIAIQLQLMPPHYRLQINIR